MFLNGDSSNSVTIQASNFPQKIKYIGYGSFQKVRFKFDAENTKLSIPPSLNGIRYTAFENTSIASNVIYTNIDFNLEQRTRHLSGITNLENKTVENFKSNLFSATLFETPTKILWPEVVLQKIIKFNFSRV